MSQVRRSAFALLCAALLSALVAGPLAAPAQAASKAAESYGSQAFRFSNEARENHDRAALRGHSCLAKYARKQAREMAEKQEIWHQDLNAVLEDCHMDYVGENVAAGFSSGKSVVKAGWMKSPGHRANILRKEFKLMAVVARKGDDGRWYAAQVFGRKA